MSVGLTPEIKRCASKNALFSMICYINIFKKYQLFFNVIYCFNIKGIDIFYTLDFICQVLSQKINHNYTYLNMNYNFFFYRKKNLKNIHMRTKKIYWEKDQSRQHIQTLQSLMTQTRVSI